MGRFVSRRKDGSIWSANAAEQHPGQEYLGDDDAELVAYLANAARPTPAVLKRSQIMRQLAADGKLDAACDAVAAADSLTKELWRNDDWRLTELQAEPFASMIAPLGIDLETFWAAATRQR